MYLLPYHIIKYHIIPFVFTNCQHCQFIFHIDDLNRNIMLFTKCRYEENIFNITLCDFCLLHRYLKKYYLYNI